MRIKHLYFALVLLLINSLGYAQAPTATIVVPSATLCTDVVYTFTANTTGTITAYSWSATPASGVTITPNNSSSTVEMKFGRNTNYNITLFVANSSGTFVTITPVSVTKSAKASYNATINYVGFPTKVTLTNYSTSFLAVNWDFGSAAPSQTAMNTSQTYYSPGSYTVSMVAYGTNGCNDTLDYSFVIDDVSDVKLVNVFTPNNDGVNDVFKPILKGIYESKVWVFDRWGVLMYNWNGINGFWDGYTTSGVECPDGVYVYVIEAKGFDGKEYKLKSNLTLIH